MRNPYSPKKHKLISEIQSLTKSLCRAAEDQENTAELELKFWELLEKIGPRHVSLFDQKMRYNLYYISSWGQSVQLPSKTERKLIATTQSGPFVLISSHNGFVREAALKGIHDIPSAFCFALILYRLNDWVPQVRAAAIQAIKRNRSFITDEILIECLDVFFRSHEWGRGQEQEQKILSDLYDRNALTVRITNEILTRKTDWAPRALRHMLQTHKLDDHLLEMALKARHPGVRRIATQVLLKRKFEWFGVRRDKQSFKVGELGTTHYFLPQKLGRSISTQFDREDLIKQGLEDPHPPVRLLCLEAYAETHRSRPDADEVFKRFLSDKAYSISDLCAFWLQIRKQDVATYLREHLKMQTVPSPPSLKLAGRFGSVHDADLLFEIALKTNGVRKFESLRAAYKLHPEKFDPILEELAFGEDVQFANIASRVLAAEKLTLPFDKLLERAKNPEDFIERGFLKLAMGLPPSKALQVGLTLTKNGCEEPVTLFKVVEKKAITYWRPSSEDLEKLKALISAQPQFHARFAFLLKHG